MNHIDRGYLKSCTDGERWQWLYDQVDHIKGNQVQDFQRLGAHDTLLDGLGRKAYWQGRVLKGILWVCGSAGVGALGWAAARLATKALAGG